MLTCIHYHVRELIVLFFMGPRIERRVSAKQLAPNA